MYPERVAKALQRARAHLHAGNAELALPELEKAVQKAPKGFEAWFLLGQAKGMLGDYAGSESALKKAVPHNPRHGDLWYNLGISYSARGEFEQAMACYHKAIVNSSPHLHAQATHNFGSCLISLEQYDEAAEVLAALARRHETADVQALLGIARQGKADFEGAVAAYERAFALGMDNYTLNLNAGVCHYSLGDFHKSVHYGERALEIKPDDGVAMFNAARSYLEMGDVAQAIQLFEKNASQPTENARLFALNFVEPYDPQQVLREHQQWAARITPQAAELAPLTVDRNPDRPLRLGFVSADLREHPVAFFLESLIARIDRTQSQLHFYSDVRTADEVTARLRQHADGWTDTFHLTDNAAVAELVRKDRIDILFDLGGHTSERVRLFGTRVAPVQASYLGYAATTGLPHMDYFITDALLDPIGMTEAHYTEKLCRLGNCFASYRLPDSAVEVADLPMTTNGFPTFASFHRLNKVSASTVARWAQVLEAVPNAKMLFVAKGLGAESGRERLLQAFTEHGVPASRLEFRGHVAMQEYLALHNEIDLILDCFPWNSHTTAMHALWMGVPTLTVAGSHHAGRFGELIARGAGMANLIAADGEEMAHIAAQLVGAPAKLRTLRQGARKRLATSVLCDHDLLASRFQQACRSMWRNFIKGSTAHIDIE
ncbi:glycosyltransferase family 41 protein [Noviherbaspirillum sp.]|jgi:predicted O-linked N-acetylglucosamine transferase (SPINDLY family)|uniref:O-linked N-acetylglucosamine transferase, SPINDLY family protein n=1 Tax=Noviherbaspirillum sp. TaxID=1926288 RepID=UPI0025EDFEC7|nr:glycosyltransferase family 41 protein [Noviherbaspirillum sp.]